MAKVKMVVFWDDAVHVTASDEGFVLEIANGIESVIFEAETRREMLGIIDGMSNSLHDIRWELDREYGVFNGLGMQEEPPAEPAEE